MNKTSAITPATKPVPFLNIPDEVQIHLFGYVNLKELSNLFLINFKISNLMKNNITNIVYSQMSGSSLETKSFVLINCLYRLPSEPTSNKAAYENLVRLLINDTNIANPMSLHSVIFAALLVKNIDLVMMTLNSTIEIDPRTRGWALTEAAEQENLPLIESILKSEKEIPPDSLGTSLANAISTKNLTIIDYMIDSILKSKREIYPTSLGRALEVAILSGNVDVVLTILESKRPICSNKLRLSFDLVRGINNQFLMNKIQSKIEEND